MASGELLGNLVHALPGGNTRAQRASSGFTAHGFRRELRRTTGETLTQQAAELGIRFELLEQDPGPDLGIERPRVLPTTLLIDPEGVVTDILVGPQTKENLTTLWESRRS